MLDIYTPITTLINKEKKSGKALVEKRTVQSIKQKYITYREFIRNKNEISKKEFLQEFKYFKNLINKLTRINKTNFYKTFFGKHKGDSKRT